MYLRRCYKDKDGKRHWALVEAHRTAQGPRQRLVAYLGETDEGGRLAVKHAAETDRDGGQLRLFDQTRPEWVEVDVNGLRVENVRDFGGPWLGLELLRQLRLDKLLERLLGEGREDVSWAVMAQIAVLARLCRPSSELRLAEDVYERLALSDIFGVSGQKVNDDRLYRTLDKLLPHKQEIERHLKERLGELFAVSYDLVLYDVTSTYFEGRMEGNKDAQRGYSRDGRGDCKQVCIGLAVTREGLPIGHEVFAGNRHDSTTLEEVVETMEARYGKADRIWVVDRVEESAEGLRVKWSRREGWRKWSELSHGCYILRSNVTEWSAEELWKAYIQLTEAEAAFRVHKSDLVLRPIWHHTSKRVKGHIMVCFLAYALWKTLSQWCKGAGLGTEPRKVLDELSELKLMDVVLPTRRGTEIRKRCVSRASAHQAILLERLGLSLPRQLKIEHV